MPAKVETFTKPIFLYRYRSLRPELDQTRQRNRNRFDEEVAAVRERFVYCSRYRDMNDPMEGLYKAARSAREDPSWGEAVREIRSEKLALGIASFSETWDHPLMWAHYADGFRGICIAYRLRRLLEELDEACTLTRMSYADRPHTLNQVRVEDRDVRAKALLSQKSVAWNYEREWRLFAMTHGRAFHGAQAVDHVYLGARMSSNQQDEIITRLSSVLTDVRPTRIKGYRVVAES